MLGLKLIHVGKRGSRRNPAYCNNLNNAQTFQIKVLEFNWWCIWRVSCQKGPTCHADAWQIGPFWQDTRDLLNGCSIKHTVRLWCLHYWWTGFTTVLLHYAITIKYASRNCYRITLFQITFFAIKSSSFIYVLSILGSTDVKIPIHMLSTMYRNKWEVQIQIKHSPVRWSHYGWCQSTFTLNHMDYSTLPIYIHCNGLIENKCVSHESFVCLSNWVLETLQYIPRNMHTVFALLCFVVVIHWLIFPYPSGLLHWHCGNLTIAPVPAKQPWWIWINTSCEFIMNDCTTTTKQITTKPCAYFSGYTVLIEWLWGEKPSGTIRQQWHIHCDTVGSWVEILEFSMEYMYSKPVHNASMP